MKPKAADLPYTDWYTICEIWRREWWTEKVLAYWRLIGDVEEYQKRYKEWR